MNKTTTVEITRINKKISENLEDTVIREYPLTIYIQDQPMGTLLCTPEDMKVLVLGHLHTESLVKHPDDILDLIIDEEKGLVYVTLKELPDLSLKHRYITSGCASSALYYDTLDAILLRHHQPVDIIAFEYDEIIDNMKLLNQKSALFLSTGGVHVAGIFNRRSCISIFEDIGRHNAVDKAIGYVFEHQISTESLMIYVSGRISSEMVLKCIKSGIRGIVSRAAPMDLAIKLAQKHGILLIGFVRGERMNIYTE